MTRDEHMRWCKERALAYVERGEYADALGSMVSDLRKHPETESLMAPNAVGTFLFGVTIYSGCDEYSVRKFINGFA